MQKLRLSGVGGVSSRSAYTTSWYYCHVIATWVQQSAQRRRMHDVSPHTDSHRTILQLWRLALTIPQERVTTTCGMTLSLFTVQAFLRPRRLTVNSYRVQRFRELKFNSSVRRLLPPDRAHLFGAILVQSVFSAQRYRGHSTCRFYGTPPASRDLRTVRKSL